MNNTSVGAPLANQVHDNAPLSRFELQLDSAVAVLDYTRRGQVLALNHAGVPAAVEGRGIGSSLVAGALALIRSRGERIVPHCSFVAAYLRRHPEFDDLRAAPP